MKTITTSAGRYRPDIDGLRAWAVLSVFFFHLQPSLLPGGFLGVDIFFVISGYLITGIILREHHQGIFSFSHFYARRVKRIFPALFVVLIFCAIAAILVLPPDSYVNFMASARYSSAQISNILFAREVSYFEEGFTGQPLLHTWSLGVEEQFYLFWPLLIYGCFLLWRRQKRGESAPREEAGNQVASPTVLTHQLNSKVGWVFLFVSMASFAACTVLVTTNYNLAFYMFFTRAFEFCMGGFIALKVLPQPASRTTQALLGFVGGALLVYSVFFIKELYYGRSFLHFGVLIPCLAAALLIHLTPSQSPLNRLLGTRLVNGIGKISYSLYLYHWPVIIFYKSVSGQQLPTPAASFFIILIAFLLATLSYFLVEQPARQTTWSDRRVLLTGGVIIIVFALLFSYLEPQSRAKWRITHYQRNPQKGPLRYNPDCQKEKQNGLLSFQCQPEAQENTPIIALVGDSHSPHFLRGVTEWALENGYNVKFLGTAGCPVGYGEIRIKSHLGVKHEHECDEAQPVFDEEILGDERVKVVLIAHRYDLFYDGKEYASATKMITFRTPDGTIVEDHSRYYETLLSNTVKTLREKGKIPVIMKQVPVFNNLDGCNWKPLINEIMQKDRMCEYDEPFLQKWQQPSDTFIETFSSAHEIDTVDPTPAFSSPVIDNLNLYGDRDHLNNFGMYHLAPYVARSLDEILK